MGNVTVNKIKKNLIKILNKKKVAIMQPYLFPYIGYFNLVYSSDVFVFLDNVTYIKSGWINRNIMIINNKQYKFTCPLEKVSSNKLICDVLIKDKKKFSEKLKKQLIQNYKKSKYFDDGYEYVKKVLDFETNKISELAIISIKFFFEYLDCNKEFITSSVQLKNIECSDKFDRVIKIMNFLNSDFYINPIGGNKIYIKSDFEKKGIKLNFLQPILKNDRLSKNIGKVSIIDLLMNTSKKDLVNYLKSYALK